MSKKIAFIGAGSFGIPRKLLNDPLASAVLSRREMADEMFKRNEAWFSQFKK